MSKVDHLSRVAFLHPLVCTILVVLSLSAPATAAAGECSDEALRWQLASTLLPDCRAYEMVTPPYKEGYPLLVKSYASDGNSAILESLATLAGNPGSGHLAPASAIYLAKRSTTGWQLSPLNAPLSQFVGELPLVYEADKGETLWEQHTPQQSISNRGLYVRSAAGDFTFIGRLTTPQGPENEPSNVIEGNLENIIRPVATTDNFDHVVLEAMSASGRWPFDQTPVDEAHHSLYEYSGTNNEEPTLIDATGPKGSDELIASCGVTLGSGPLASRYNALSRDGETVFFTVNPCGSEPQTAELYARLHGSIKSTEAAETIDVSKSVCTVACGEEESGKNFEGASEDGTRVYFTSTQKLTNNAADNTASGEATKGCSNLPGGCNLYLYDVSKLTGTRLQAVSTGGEVLGVAGIAEDGSHIYYVSRHEDPTAEANVYGDPPIQGAANLYVYDAINNTTAFIAILGNTDKSDYSKVFSKSAEVAGKDGRFLLFVSAVKGLTTDDTAEVMQLYEYRAATGDEPAELERVTKGEDQFNGDGNDVDLGFPLGTIQSVNSLLGIVDYKSTTNRLSVSRDGRTVFFLTAGQLSPRASSSAEECRSLYEFRTNGTLSEGTVRLVSDGRDTQLYKGVLCGPELHGVDATGDNVLFTASDPLLSNDVDGVQRDIYDARVEGGFSTGQGGGLCNATTCEGPSSAPPQLPVSGSIGANSPVSAALTEGKAGTRTRTLKKKKKKKKKRACRTGVRSQKMACRHRPAHKRLSLKTKALHATTKRSK